MHGHLDIVAGRAANEETVLRRQSFAPPIHVSKPHHDAGWLVVNLASPTPGLLAGDRVDVRVAVETGAHLLLTAPSASRIHAMAEGYAELTQYYHIAAGGVLDIWPEYLIPQKDARYQQRTRIEVEPGGTLLWTETVAPGRTARGEVFEFTELQLVSDILHGTRPLVRERYVLTRDGAAVASLRRKFSQAYYASVVAVAPEPAVDVAELKLLHALHAPESLWLGATRLSASAVAVKILAADSPSLRAAVASVRAILFRWLRLEPASLRRITGAPVAATF